MERHDRRDKGILIPIKKEKKKKKVVKYVIKWPGFLNFVLIYNSIFTVYDKSIAIQ